MALREHVPDEEYLREHWPLLFGIAVLFVGHVYYYGMLDADWQPVSPPLIVALVLVLLVEVGRGLWRQWSAGA